MLLHQNFTLRTPPVHCHAPGDGHTLAPSHLGDFGEAHMDHRQGMFNVVLALGLVLGAPGAQADRPFDYVTIEVPDSVVTRAFGINAAGHIVGSYIGNDGTEGAFLLRNGQYTRFVYPGAGWTEARGINPRGDIVGMYGYFEPGSRSHGFLRTADGQFFPIDYPGAMHTWPTRISPTGKIVGCFHSDNTNTTMYGFELASGGYSNFHLHSTMHNGVSPDGGTVVGLRQVPGTPTEGYILQRGVYTPFMVPDSLATTAWDVNAGGEIVGFYRLAGVPLSAAFRGYLRSAAGDFTTIHFPGATQTRAFGINSGGDVVGFYISGGLVRGFLLSRSQRLIGPSGT
ncbi:MAG: hypothetical protein KF822_12145 [Steroidobacteraceae bacterium]|nr:hypothetical protein [Steroidobacteraceae bacterium]